MGNIPYDASEEKLKDIFSEVGPVISFKLVYDRESGKPKGYGFCEYRDQETASSAMRNLNGHELAGRNLRVDTATNERFREEMKNLQTSLTGNTFESPYGAEVDPEEAPETIAKVVASFAPEQMVELARQVKHCVMTNPAEARNMLVQNPQLAYALLQAMVMIRAIDVNAASSVLYKQNPAPMVIPPGNMGPVPVMPPQMMGMPPQQVPHPGMMPVQQPPPQSMPPPMFDHHQLDHPHGYNRPPMGGGPPPPPQQQHQPAFDSRNIDPRLRQADPRSNEMFDHRVPTGPPQAPAPLDPRIRNQPVGPPGVIRGPSQVAPSVLVQAPPQAAQQTARPSFPPIQQNPSFPPIRGPAPLGVAGGGQPNILPSENSFQSETEKAQLIMQVLALSDQQIAVLPADQRQSILQLKEQLCIQRGQWVGSELWAPATMTTAPGYRSFHFTKITLNFVQ